VSHTKDEFFNNRVTALTEKAGPEVVGMLAWWDPSGQLWIAPLGSPAPSVPMPAAWLPVKREQRTDLI